MTIICLDIQKNFLKMGFKQIFIVVALCMTWCDITQAQSKKKAIWYLNSELNHSLFQLRNKTDNRTLSELTVNGLLPSPFFTNRIDTVGLQSGWGITNSFLLRYPNRINISVGLGYQFYKQEYLMTYYRPTYGGREITGEGVSRLHYLNLHLGLSYTIWQKNKLSISPFVHIDNLYNFRYRQTFDIYYKGLLHKEASAIISNTTYSIEGTDTLNNIIYSERKLDWRFSRYNILLGVGLRLDFQISPKLGIYISEQIQHTLWDIKSDAIYDHVEYFNNNFLEKDEHGRTYIRSLTTSLGLTVNLSANKISKRKK